MDSYVVKVKNEGTMRRLTLAKGEQGFSYEQLQRRIRDLFQLPTSEFGLSYIDKDGDVVTMGEDEDLRDALVQQKLNPLRVTIENIQGGTDDVKVDSPLVQNELNSDEVKEQFQLRTEGEQIREDLSKSSSVVDSVANPEPVVNMENLTVPDDKEWTIIENALDSNPSKASLRQSGTSVDAVEVDPAANAESVINSGETSTLGEQVSSPAAGTSVDAVKVDSAASAEPVINSGETSPATGTSVDAVNVNPAASAERVIDSAETSTVPEEEVSAVVDDTSDPTSPDASSPASEASVDASKGISPEGTTTEDKKSLEAEEAKDFWERQTHFGIQCDSCGMTPIAGPRFKSCKKADYDLCLKCYEASDTEEDEYVKIVRLFYPGGCPAYAGRMCRRPNQRTCRRPDQCRTWTPNSEAKNSTASATPEAGKKDPGTENSTKVLHQGVKCDGCSEVPIQGPRFRSATRFNYDLCNSCFEKSGSNSSEYTRIDEPLTRGAAPLLVMRHLSRRAFRDHLQHPISPQWVWILNQMVPVIAIDQAGADEKTATTDSDVKVSGDTENIPQAESGAAKEPVDATSSASKLEEGATSDQRAEDRLNNFPRVERELVQMEWVDTRQPASGTSSTPETQKPAQSTENGAANNSAKRGDVEGKTEQRSSVGEGSVSRHEALLAKLAAMGFEDPKVNAELLEKNNFDLRKTLNDLCQAEEWDPILGELQEMGFYDASLNRRLLFKYNGSVKRVVKELVELDRGQKLV